MVRSAGDLIDALGGSNAVAKSLGVKHNTVASWRSRGFPPWASIRLRAIAAGSGIATDAGIFEIRRGQRTVRGPVSAAL
jgi:hypothetical protein